MNFENEIKKMVEGVINEVKESTSGIFDDKTEDFPTKEEFYKSFGINSEEKGKCNEFSEILKKIRKGLYDISEDISEEVSEKKDTEKSMSFEKRMENIEEKLDSMSEAEKLEGYKNILNDIRHTLNNIKINIPEYMPDSDEEEEDLKTPEKSVKNDKDIYVNYEEEEDNSKTDVETELRMSFEDCMRNIEKTLSSMTEEEREEHFRKNGAYIEKVLNESRKDKSNRAGEGLNNLGSKNTKYATDYAPEVLETFENKHPNRDYFVKFNCPEFTSLCPITSQPDFATIYISYIPDKKMVESKSLKLYLFSFRNHGDFHEDCVNIIMNDLIKLMNPKYIEVWGKFLPRGGISIDPYCNYGRPDTKWERLAWERLSHHDLYPENIDNR